MLPDYLHKHFPDNQWHNLVCSVIDVSNNYQATVDDVKNFLAVCPTRKSLRKDENVDSFVHYELHKFSKYIENDLPFGLWQECNKYYIECYFMFYLGRLFKPRTHQKLKQYFYDCIGLNVHPAGQKLKINQRFDRGLIFDKTK